MSKLTLKQKWANQTNMIKKIRLIIISVCLSVFVAAVGTIIIKGNEFTILKLNQIPLALVALVSLVLIIIQLNILLKEKKELKDGYNIQKYNNIVFVTNKQPVIRILITNDNNFFTAELYDDIYNGKKILINAKNPATYKTQVKRKLREIGYDIRKL